MGWMISYVVIILVVVLSFLIYSKSKRKERCDSWLIFSDKGRKVVDDVMDDIIYNDLFPLSDEEEIRLSSDDFYNYMDGYIIDLPKETTFLIVKHTKKGNTIHLRYHLKSMMIEYLDR